jgi:apolipoprotein N-acyltransferase
VVFDVNGVKILPSICYEAIYPGLTREAVMEDPKADMILNITNDMWFGDTSALTMHLMVQTSRAVELRVPLVRSTNSGITVFVDATGRLTGETPRYEALATRGIVEVKSTFSLYSHLGDVPMGVAVLIMFAVCGFRPTRSEEVCQESKFSEQSMDGEMAPDSET